MALTRPPVPSCGTFAALAPQLQTLALAADDDMGLLSTSEIFRALDSPVATVKQVGTYAHNGGDFYSATGFDTLEFNNNKGITTLATTAPFDTFHLPALPRPRWYYIGLYVQLAQSPVNTRWQMELFVSNINQLTLLDEFHVFFRSYQAPSTSGTGAEYLWFETYVYSSGGGVNAYLRHDQTAVSINSTGGRMWVIGQSTKR